MNYNSLITKAIESGLIPFLEGSPGTAKSTLIRQVAEDFNLKLIDVRLSTLEPSDLTGIPFKTEVDLANGSKADRVRHAPSTLFPISGDALPPKLDKDGIQLLELPYDEDGKPILNDKNKHVPVPAFYDGWFIFFDEMTSAMPAMQGAVFRILLEREVSEYKLHPSVVMAAAGNREQDKAVVFPMSTPLRTRLCFIEVTVDLPDWIKWATKEGINSKVITYLQWKPDMLNAFDPHIKQLNCAIPRTWHFASNLINNEEDLGNAVDETNVELFTLLKGVIGTAAIEFKAFLAVYSQLPDIKKILKDPKNADVPTEAGHQYALASVIAEEMARDTTTANDFMAYLERMEPELQTVACMEAVRKNRKLFRETAMSSWVTANQDMITASI